MWKYIVTWIVVSYGIGSCPDSKKENSFGISGNTMTSCAVMHIDVKEFKKQKEFKDKKSASLFLDSIESYRKKTIKDFYFMGDDRIEKIKLDSINAI